MRVIEGFQSAKSVLSRLTPAELFPASPGLKRRLKEMFGVDDPELVVKEIVDNVRRHGDSALLDYALKIDGVKLTSLEISKKQIASAYREVSDELLSAMKLACERIRSFHSAQNESMWGGTGKTRSRIHPLERVGVYVPGGSASYPSTVLMTAVPARVAGVKEIIMTTPPRSNGTVPPLTLVAADIAGVDRVFAVGGAQAIAALAFGTKSIPKVDKICGPGNIFVVLAKKMVYGMVGIDGLQGPSEVLIIADDKANPEYCAADLLAQSEHDALAAAVLVTTSRRFAAEVEKEVERQLKDLPRQAITAESLQSRGVVVVVDNIDEAIELANLYAPEHLCLMVEKANNYVERLVNAGCIVTGRKPTVVLGDYVAGPSHVLPTGGTARFSSPLNIGDFIKITNVVDVNNATLKEIGPAAATMAHAEGLEAHARAVEKRLKGAR